MGNEYIVERQVRLDGFGLVDGNGFFDVVLMAAGEAKGHGIIFPADALQAAVDNRIFDTVECFVDHSLWGHGVRDLGGVFYAIAWDGENEAITAELRTLGPSGALVAQLGQEMICDDEPKPRVGFSADVIITLDKDDEVTNIVKCYSVDLVFNPALGGAFTRALNAVQSNKEAETMKAKVEKPNEPEAVLVEDQNAIRELLGVAKEQQKAADEVKKTRAIRVEMCAHLLETGIGASKLPEPAKIGIRNRFAGVVFEPADLQKAIEEQRQLVSDIQAESVVAGVPGGLSSVYNTADKLQAAVDDLLGAPREKEAEGLKAARLTGIRELYTMLTGDRDFYGGYFPSRVQLATTADFTGLVANSLNKIVVNTWEQLGRAGYDWWKSITVQEHFTTLNTITGTLVGTVGELPSIAESGEYTPLTIGDSPETADFTKYGGYVPLTLELIDRDNVRKLRQYPRELAAAGLRMISKLVSEIFTDNSAVGPTMADTGALFNATAVTTGISLRLRFKINRC